MRFFLARLVVTSAFVSACALGCANRGMVAPEETGTGGGAQLGGSGGASSLGGHGGGTGGGAGGKGGGSGGSGGSGGTKMDAGCSLTTDALFDHSTTTCGTMFNFEGSTEGATLLGGSQAFTGIAQGTLPHTYCGSGSLAIAATFSGTTGALVKGEVDVPLGADGGSVDLSAKTLTVHVAATPAACGEDLRFKVVLDTTAGAPIVININALTTNFSTASASLSTVAGASATNRIGIQAFSTTGYNGTIYVDEIDLK